MRSGTRFGWAAVAAGLLWVPAVEAGTKAAPQPAPPAAEKAAQPASSSATGEAAGATAPASGEASPGAAGDTDDRSILRVVQDGATVEKRIADFTRARDNISPGYRYTGKNNDDLYLEYNISPTDVPSLRCVVDTAVSGRGSDDTTVSERMIKVTCYYILPDAAKTSRRREELLELNNRWIATHWIPHRWYIDDEGDLVAESLVNIPSVDAPVSIEQVRDLLIRMVDSWAGYYKELAKIVPLKQDEKTKK